MEADNIMDLETVEMITEILKNSRVEVLEEIEKVIKEDEEDLFTKGWGEGYTTALENIIKVLENIPGEIEVQLEGANSIE